MSKTTTLRIYLEPPMLATARAGTFNFLNVLRDAVETAGWQVEWRETGSEARRRAPDLPGYALFHAEAPTHDRALTFRRAYHYPFWQIEPVQQRWRFHVAASIFDPDSIDPQPAAAFVDKLRNRVLPGPDPTREGFALVALQGHLRKQRSFQTMRPLDMVKEVARTGRPAVATLHPSETYDDKDMAALDRLAARFPNLVIGGQTQTLLRACDFVVTQNSAVAFDGLILGKPAVLFGQSDFHHIALNVADLGAEQALRIAADSRPDHIRYIYWFLRIMAVNATAGDARGQIRAAMKRGGWPIDQPPPG
ncbi:hypothetical protein PE067_02870 [Paracoccus sp. DMF-8]|uniref:hypothetical protein n=1 Tax=Paracoccus sp. DMF-8 TaxID=3019445 RepID=UPI0023E7EDDC|nr:hypothetical protein [Paracoccus sp. DMF-8]MDF3605195.1 hypothetical protein [Paracoccus sp. DMF-8]